MIDPTVSNQGDQEASNSIPPGYKRCRGACGKILPATEDYYYVNRSQGKSFLYSRCKACHITDSNQRVRERKELSVSSFSNQEAQEVITNPEAQEAQEVITNPETQEAQEVITNPEAQEAQKTVVSVQPGEKRCSVCGKIFPATSAYFHLRGTGLRHDCKSCHNTIGQRARKNQGIKEQQFFQIISDPETQEGQEVIADPETQEGQETVGSGEPGEKHCTVCGRSFPATNEYFYRNGAGYLKSACKPCHNKRSRGGKGAETLSVLAVEPDPETQEGQAIIISGQEIQSGEKRCSVCGNIFPATTDHFYTSRSSNEKQYLKGLCKSCFNARGNQRKRDQRAQNQWEVCKGTPDQCGACGAEAMSILGDVNNETHKQLGYLCMKCYKIVRESKGEVERVNQVAAYMKLTRKQQR
jgi:hypothetical protein